MCGAQVMNETGQILLSVRLDSQSWSDELVLDAFDRAHDAGMLKVDVVPTVVCVCAFSRVNYRK